MIGPALVPGFTWLSLLLLLEGATLAMDMPARLFFEGEIPPALLLFKGAPPRRVD